MGITVVRVPAAEAAPPVGHRLILPAVRDSRLRRLLGVADAGAIVVAMAIMLALPPDPPRLGHDFFWGLVTVPLFVVVFKLYGLYDRDVKRLSHSSIDDLPWLLHATLVGSLLLWLYSKETPMNQLPVMSVVNFGVLAVGLVVVARATMRRFAARVLGPEPALLVGAGDMAGVLVSKLRAHPEYRVDVVGALETGQAGEVSRLPLLGSIGDLERIAKDRGIGRIVLSQSGVDDSDLAELLRRCRKLALKVTLLPKLADTLGANVEVDDVEGVTVLGVNPPWLPRSSRALKRTMDIAVAAPLLLLLSPVFLLLAIAIKLDSRGPVFFAQQRVGKGGRRFRVFKFRTMVPNAEDLRAELLVQSCDPGWLKLEVDPRITRFGRRLRRFSLDELPQLWNVVRGEMSLVGPRPLIEADDGRVQGWARGRLDLTPGITGYWQVLGRTRIPFEEMVKLDYLYVMNWSLWEDVRLMLRTLPVVIAGRGAN